MKRPGYRLDFARSARMQLEPVTLRYDTGSSLTQDVNPEPFARKDQDEA